jgi:hypothetical protein
MSQTWLHPGVAALIAVMLVSGCAHAPKKTGEASLGPAMGVIAGTVTDGDGVLLQNCNVIVKDSGSDNDPVKGKLFGVLTGADGKYSIPRVPGGTYKVVTEMLGFVRQTRDKVHVSRDDTTIVDFKLQPRYPGDGFHIKVVH